MELEVLGYFMFEISVKKETKGLPPSTYQYRDVVA